MAEDKLLTKEEKRAVALKAVAEFFAHPNFQITRLEDSPHYQETIKRSPIITIDANKCGNALECLKCLQVCNNRVLCIMPVYAEDEPAQRMEPADKAHGVQVWMKGSDEPNPETRPRVVMPFVPELCTYSGCTKCIDVCPKDAITISVSHL